MKKSLKNLFLAVITIALIGTLMIGVFTASAVSDDPADTYVKQTAPKEDASIDLWFEHSFKKVMTGDTVSSGMDTYSVYMAKNEIENAQFVLYSDKTVSGLNATVTSFKNDNGDEISSEILYQMYVTATNLNLGNIYGAEGPEDEIIREGEIPDPVTPLKYVAPFQLNGGKSQAFYIKLRTDENTPAGWYSAQLDIKNSKGEIIKTATVFAYVWDFTISEETALKSSFIMSNDSSYGGSYEKFYDYLLDNRLMAADIPGRLKADNPYLTNPRVSAVRISAYTETEKVGSRYSDSNNFNHYKDIYNRLATSDVWEDIKDKLYFYKVDEPLPGELVAATGGVRDTVESAHLAKVTIDNEWGEDNAVIAMAHGENHAYPYNYYYTKSLWDYPLSELRDAEQEIIDYELCTAWCPRMYGFTPMAEIANTNYQGLEESIIRTNSGPYSGTVGITMGYYNWEQIYGEFSDRVLSQMAMANNGDRDHDIELWAYSAGANKGYTYANHLIENTGLQTKILFWQLYQEDVTGYLYYAVNNWREMDKQNGNFMDSTVTGALGTDEDTAIGWKTNPYPFGATGKQMYGNGVLFYGAFQGSIWDPAGVVGSTRVEIMRDGVEEYQMLTMIEELLGNDAAKAIVKRVSNNVVNYLSLPKFSTAGWDDGMDEYDIMASVRRDMGNTLEAATLAGKCDHDYDNGVVTVDATCLKVGYTQHTCKKCGATESRVIPAHHSVGDCFEFVSGTVADCTNNGRALMKCAICGFEQYQNTTAFHNDPEYYEYSSKSAAVHNITCKVCGDIVDTQAHNLFNELTSTCTESGEMRDSCKNCEYYTVLYETGPRGHKLEESKVEPTCTDDGYQGLACTRCAYTEAATIPAKGHAEAVSESKDATCTVDGYDRTYCPDCGEVFTETIYKASHKFYEGICTVCKEPDPDYVPPAYTLGDINADGAINGKDSNQLKQIISGSSMPTDTEQKAADVKTDGSINGMDANLLAQFLAGAIGGF